MDDFYSDNLGRFDKVKKVISNRKDPFIPPRNGTEWTALLKKIKASGGPDPNDFTLQTTETEWNSMLKKLEECGLMALAE